MNMNTPNKKSFEGVKFKGLLNGKPKEYSISFVSCIFFFLVFTIIDIILSVHQNFYVDVAAMSGIGLLYIILFAFSLLSKKAQPLPLMVFLITATVLSFMDIKNGYWAGSYLYLFPAAVGYINSTTKINTKIRFRGFYIIIFYIAALLTIQFFLLPHHANEGLEALFIYRLAASIILTAVLINHLILLQSFKKITDGKTTYNEALFQSYKDAYIIYNKDTLEVTDYNERMIQMFDLPALLDMKGLYISQVMMRYLAGDSINLDLLMNNIPDEWEGEAGFMTHTKK